MFDELLPYLFLRDLFIVLRGAKRCNDLSVSYRDLCFSVWSQPRKCLVAAELLQTPGERMRQNDAERQHFFRFIGRVAIHNSLVARAACVHAEGNVGGLLCNGDDYLELFFISDLPVDLASYLFK